MIPKLFEIIGVAIVAFLTYIFILAIYSLLVFLLVGDGDPTYSQNIFFAIANVLIYAIPILLFGISLFSLIKHWKRVNK